ncbi:MAG: caspase family protein [Acidobacteriota bacterium]
MPDRAALIVGIDAYEFLNDLTGCHADARAVETVLKHHRAGEEKNFECLVLPKNADLSVRVDRATLKDSIKHLFERDVEVAIFYFAGHGFLERETGAYLVTTDARRGDEGVSLVEVVALANRGRAKTKVIILDCCHAGAAGEQPHLVPPPLATLSDGLIILASTTKGQRAIERNRRGIFTLLLIDALRGAAADLTGNITAASVYTHIDQSLGAWEQRPVFKANVSRFVSLRKVHPPISRVDLHRLTDLFSDPDAELALDPSFEPEMKGREPGMEPPDPVNTTTFRLLQTYHRLNLLVPVGAEHMWNAAMESKSCRLTVRGKHYHRLVENELI